MSAILVIVLSFTAFVVGTDGYRPAGHRVGELADNFTLRDPHGRQLSLNSFQGQPVLVVFDDAAGSGLLGSLDPLVEALAPFRDQPVTLLAVSPTTAPLPGVDLVAEQSGVVVTPLCDAQRSVANRYEISELPTALAVAPDGTIISRGSLADVTRDLVRVLTATSAAPTSQVPTQVAVAQSN